MTFQLSLLEAPQPRNPLSHLLQIETIYHEPEIEKWARAREILVRFPDAKRIEVPSHWQIAELNGNAAAASDYLKTKRGVLVLGVKKSLSCLAYSRSCDWVAPSHSNGCALACAYCYVSRRKGYANPITTFVNIEQILRYIDRHATKQGPKLEPNDVDDKFWVYELGCNSDCSVDAAVSENIRDLIELFRRLPNAKCTFATKFVNRDLLAYDPRGKARIRFSLLPFAMAKLTDVRAAPVEERIGAINDFVAAGWEVNINFGPIIYSETWQSDYRELFAAVNDHLSPQSKAQMAAEVIFLTHNEKLHQLNEQWHPKAEEVLWRPEIQEKKISETGGVNVRYKLTLKRDWVAQFRQMLQDDMPYCKIRYAF